MTRMSLCLVLATAPLFSALFAARVATPRLRPLRCGVENLEAAPFWDEFEAEAQTEAEALGLDIKSLIFDSGKLSVLASGAGVDELQQLNSHLSQFLDARSGDEVVESMPAFLLEVSSPGLSNVLKTEQEYRSFKGFPVTVVCTEPFKNKESWEGTLVGRDEKSVTINLKGRPQKIPVELVAEVRLPEAAHEPGDPLAT